MNKSLIEKQSRDLVLKRSNSSLRITNKILSTSVKFINNSIAKQDEVWIETLWKWADDNAISKNLIPRQKYELINLEKLNLNGTDLNYVIEEICYLKNLSFLDLSNNNLKFLPNQIGNLKKLTFLSIVGNRITKLPKSIVELKRLNAFWVAGNSDLGGLSSEQETWLKDLKGQGCYIYH